ncbi:MAG: hypothetical protein ABJD13_15225 [Paracoccaceae bacterium]
MVATPVTQSSEAAFAQQTASAASIAAVAAAFGSIPEDDQEAQDVFLSILKEFDGDWKSTKAIAALLNMTPAQVENAKERIRYHCRTKLKNMDLFWE